MRRLTVDLQALIDAMTMPEEVPWRSFLDLRDGAIVEVDLENEDDLDGEIDTSPVASDAERYLEIPRLESREEYTIMAAFAASDDDEEVGERLGEALHGRGAFSRFRRLIDSDRELRERWFAFRRDQLIQHARRWLAALDLDPLQDPAVEESKPLSVPAPRAASTIGLLDILLLGAPDGKTELLGGPGAPTAACRDGLRGASHLYAGRPRALLVLRPAMAETVRYGTGRVRYRARASHHRRRRAAALDRRDADDLAGARSDGCARATSMAILNP